MNFAGRQKRLEKPRSLGLRRAALSAGLDGIGKLPVAHDCDDEEDESSEGEGNREHAHDDRCGNRTSEFGGIGS